MNISTFTRTFADFEEPHIAQFIESHLPFSDTIYIGTVHTSPKTIAIGNAYYPRVQFREFNNTIRLDNGLITCHESLYYKFLSDWAIEENVDVAIFDDSDHCPNLALQRDARAIFEAHPDTPFFYSLLMYVYGTDFYFPELNNCNPSERLWAWNTRLWTPDIGTSNPNTVEIKNQPDARFLAGEGYKFQHPPYCIRHYSYLTEEIIQKKMAFNHARGVPVRHPLESCGRLDPLPDWAT